MSEVLVYVPVVVEYLYRPHGGTAWCSVPGTAIQARAMMAAPRARSRVWPLIQPLELGQQYHVSNPRRNGMSLIARTSAIVCFPMGPARLLGGLTNHVGVHD